MKNTRYNVLNNVIIPSTLALAVSAWGGNAAACGDVPKTPTVGSSAGGRVTVTVGSYSMSYWDNGYEVSSGPSY